MESDEKMKSGVDSILPVGHEDHTPSESAADTAAGKSGSDAAAKLEPSFGMPSFDFFTEPRADTRSQDTKSDRAFGEPKSDMRGFKEAKSEPRGFSEPKLEPINFGDSRVEPLSFGGADSRSEPKGAGARSSRDLPLNDGTGWQSGSSIERQGSLRAIMNAAGAENERPLENIDDLPEISILQPETPPRQQATVMPFPGTTFPRQPEPSSNPILGGREIPDMPEFSGASDDEDADYEGGDQLADAVQSALRNIYGARSDDNWQEDGENGGGGVADALIGSDHRVSDVMWPEDHGTSAAYAEDERESAHAEANTEAVLEYLYGNRRVEHVETLTLDTALRDIDPDVVGMQPQYQDDDGYDDRIAPFPSNRGMERDPYRGSGPMSDHRYSEPALPLQPQYQQLQQQPHQPHQHQQEWQQPAYMANLPARTSGPYASAAPEQLASPSDSGHLLGAAGLGLIGGIALAGVLAVFVFNSFVDINDPMSDNVSHSKHDGRLQSSANAISPGEQRTALAVDPVASDNSLSVRGVSGQAGEAVRLAITLANTARADDALVSIKGLPKEAKLSTGIDVGGGQWLLPPARLKNLSVTVPAGLSGSFSLGAQLLKDDAQTSLTEPVYFMLTIGSKTAMAPATTATDASAAAPKPVETASAPEETTETDFLTQMLIRDGNKAMRDGDITAARRLYEQAAANGSPEAALAMGRSYDPTYFERLNVKNGKPDPATAFEWYKRALDGGLSTARIKMDALKLWLQK